MARPRFQDQRFRLPEDDPLAGFRGIAWALLFAIPVYAVAAWVLWLVYGPHP